jgi:hypothetical protein
MFYIVHVLAGAVIAKYFPNIFIIMLLGLISHFLIDAIPHRDSLFTKEFFKKSYKLKIGDKGVLLEIIDFLIIILLIIFIQIKFDNLLMLFSIFVSLLPDIIKIGYFARLNNNKIFRKYIYFHLKIQKEIPWIPGLLTQLIVSLIFIKLLF